MKIYRAKQSLSSCSLQYGRNWAWSKERKDDAVNDESPRYFV